MNVPSFHCLLFKALHFENTEYIASRYLLLRIIKNVWPTDFASGASWWDLPIQCGEQYYSDKNPISELTEAAAATEMGVQSTHDWCGLTFGGRLSGGVNLSRARKGLWNSSRIEGVCRAVNCTWLVALLIAECSRLSPPNRKSGVESGDGT